MSSKFIPSGNNFTRKPVKEQLRQLAKGFSASNGKVSNSKLAFSSAKKKAATMRTGGMRGS